MSNLKQKYPDNFCDAEHQYTWPPGWDKLVNELIENVISVCKDVKVLQIKEKFAGLRFYYGNGNEEVSKLVAEAENKSSTMCQGCGELGKIDDSKFWLAVVCDKCKK